MCLLQSLNNILKETQDRMFGNTLNGLEQFSRFNDGRNRIIILK